MKRNNRKQEVQPSYISVGIEVFFHVHRKESPDKNFLCRGIITRVPIVVSNVYKIQIKSVCPKTLTHGIQEEEARSFLGKIYPIEPTGVKESSSSWMNMSYPEPWVK